MSKIPERINIRKAGPSAAVKENVTRNIIAMAKTSNMIDMDLVKQTKGPGVGGRSQTLLDIQKKLNDRPKATTSTAAVAPVTRRAVTARAPIPTVAPRRQPVVVKPTKSAPVESKATTKSVAKRIPPYDYKARFNDLKEKHDVLKGKHEDLRSQLATFDDLPEQFEQCKNELAQSMAEGTELKAELEIVKAENATVKATNADLMETIRQLSAKVEHYETYCPKLETELNTLKATFEKTKVENERFVGTVKHLEGELRHCADQLFSTNIERKNLHNEVMDLRGNIRVFCRVRPPLSNETFKRLCQWTYLDECSLEIQNVDEKSKATRHDFAFDHVFHPNSPQLDIFEMVAPLIQSALDGYNVCIFAYGQTGSGKTYTMDGVPEDLGVIPRTVDLVFKAVRDYRRLGWQYEIRAQFLEIYNEVLYDLLSNDDKKLDICMVSPNNKTEVYVSNLTEAAVETEDDLRQLIAIAKQNRMTACTAGNERSSRSHAVTKITLIGTHDGKQERCVGNINLVDLAGSESPKTSNRMDETKSINKSLSELSNVILALVQRNEHIPYRNSKLTHLLMPSLGGNSKTLMFVNVAPFSDCHGETVKSLRFASTVNSCKMSKVKKNRVLNTTA